MRGLDELAALRSSAGDAFFEAEAERLARCCRELAERLGSGARLVALGSTPAARSDARHVTVEFVHPVIVGKRSLPALAIAPEGGPLPEQADSLLRPNDAVMALGAGEALPPDAADALDAARSRGCLTIAFADAAADWAFAPPSRDAFVAQEIAETSYHVLWELVHVFLDHGAGEGGASGVPVAERPSGAGGDPGPAGFLYPFLSGGGGDPAGVVEDVRASILAKAGEVRELRERTLADNREAIAGIAADLRAAFGAGRAALVFGNGGSATDAADLVADLRFPPREPGAGWPSRPALDLTEDSAVLTAVANDIGVEEVFQRQVIAHGRAGDVAVAISTSGDSGNLAEALAAARDRGLRTVALLGYDGGRIAAEGLADRIVVARSQHIPRIQEAQASVYHVVRELVEDGD